MRHLPTWSRLPKYEQLSLFLTVVSVAGALALFSLWMNVARVPVLVKSIGLGSLGVAALVTAYAMYRVIRERLGEGALHLHLRAWLFRHRILVGIWLVCTLLAMTTFPQGNRILMDEIVVLSTSKAIHEEKEPVTPTLFETYHGVNKLAAAFVDKRPYLFAALVGLFHDLLGYSPANAFYANMLFGALTLAIIGIVGARLGGSPAAGGVAMLALTSLPVFCEHVTGGGIDILNLLCILLLLLGSILHLERPTPWSMTALLGAGLLLAYARYESILFFGLPVVIVALVWKRTHRLFLNWSTLLLWPALLPLFAIHFLTFSRSAESFQLADQKVPDAFSLSYISENLEHAVAFFLNTEHLLANSPVLFILGVIAVVLLVVAGVGRLSRGDFRGPGVEYWIFAAISAMCFALLMAYSWGRLDQVVASRLSLPVNLLFVLSIAAICREFMSRRVPIGLGCLFAVSIYWFCFPIAAKKYGFTMYASAQRQSVMDRFIETQPDRRFAVLNNITIFWVTRDVYTLTPSSISTNPEYLANMLRSGDFRRIYLIQSIDRDKKTDTFAVNKTDILSVPVDHELISEDMLAPDLKLRISLIKPSSVEKLLEESKKRKDAAAEVKVGDEKLPLSVL